MPETLERQVAQAQIVLKKRLTALVEDAQGERTAGNTSKVLGLTSLALGSLAAVTAGGLATVPIGVGLVAYLSAVVGQARKTGRVMPLPFNDTSTTELLGGVAGASLELPELEDYAYMSTQQKAEYAMILCCGNRIAHALAQMETDQHRQFAYAVAKRRFMQMYGQHIKDTPELLLAVDAEEVAEYVLAGEEDFKRLRAEMRKQALPEAEPEPETQRGHIGSTTKLGAIATEAETVTEQEERPQFERSPWIPEAMRDQIHAEVAAVAEAAARQQSYKSMMQGMHLAERIHPRRQRTGAPTHATPETLVQPAVEVVEQPVEQLVEGGGWQPVEQPVGQVVEPDPAEVALFEELVEPFCPLALDGANGTTQEAIREALRLGKSQNWITANLFKVSKGTKPYEQAVEIIKAIKEG